MVEQRDGRRLTRKGAIAVSLGTLALVLSGCSLHTDNKWWNQTINFGFPTGVTPEGTAIREFWTMTVITSLIVGAIVWGLIFWSMAFHRKKKNDDGSFPRQTAYNVPLELIYTAVPFVIISVLFYFTVATQNTAMHLAPEDEVDVRVDVTAFQWNWKFGYNKVDVPGASIEDGRNYEAQEQAAEDGVRDEETRRELGTDGEMADGGPVHGRLAEDLAYLHYNHMETVGTSEEVPVLVLPTDSRIEFRLASADVIHSFWVPEFIYKLDTMPHPGRNQQLDHFQISEIDREGAFVGRCAEMCGTYHAMMNFEIRAVSPDAFAEYINFREDNPLATNADALDHINEEPYATSTSPFQTGRSDTRELGGDNTIDNVATR